MKCTDCNDTGLLDTYDGSYLAICHHNGRVSFKPLVKRVSRRDGSTSPRLAETPIGWFHINDNWWGWTLSELSDFEREWFADQGVSTDGVYRTISENGNCNIACFRFDKGTFAFMDGIHHLNTDEIKWMRFTPYTKVFIDDAYWNDVFPVKK
jgi:hypothetical protein